jgi:hypothetical protein
MAGKVPCVTQHYGVTETTVHMFWFLASCQFPFRIPQTFPHKIIQSGQTKSRRIDQHKSDVAAHLGKSDKNVQFLSRLLRLRKLLVCLVVCFCPVLQVECKTQRRIANRFFEACLRRINESGATVRFYACRLTSRGRPQGRGGSGALSLANNPPPSPPSPVAISYFLIPHQAFFLGSC